MNDWADTVAARLGDGGPDPAGDDEQALFRRAVAGYLLEDYGAALESLRRLAERSNNPRWLLNLGFMLCRQRRYRDALSAFAAAVEDDPFYLDAHLNCLKTHLLLKEYAHADRYRRAVNRLAPKRPDVIRANALYFLETGQMSEFQRAVKELPDAAVFARPADNDIRRLKENPSLVIGGNRVSVMIAVFAGAGLRTVMVGYRDPKNVWPQPELSYRWHPLTVTAQREMSIERLDIPGDDVAMIGLRANGLETGDGEEVLGLLIADFTFADLSAVADDSHGGLLLIDCDRHLRLEPRKLLKHEVEGVAEGDLLDLYQDLLMPKATYTAPNRPDRPRVFLSYAREDAVEAERIFRGLREHDIDVWKDDKTLRIGEDFDRRIADAIEAANFAVVCLSSRSVNKIGYVQKEFRQIVEAADFRPRDVPFALPVRLDDCKAPREFRHLHWLDCGEDTAGFIAELARQILDLHRQHIAGDDAVDDVDPAPSPDADNGESQEPPVQTAVPGAVSPPANLHIRFERPHLIGRDGQLHDLHDMLGRGHSAITASVNGQGGIGKTQLAVSYAYTYAAHYPDGVFWITAEDAPATVRRLAAFAAEIALPDPGGPIEDYYAARARQWLMWLREHPRTLIVLDNLHDTDLLRIDLPGLPDWRLSALPCRVLITTRLARLPGVGVLALDVLNQDDARALLVRDAGKPLDSEADVVACLLGRLPLALRLAGGWLRRAGRTCGELVRRLRAAGLVDTFEGLSDLDRPLDYERRLAVMLRESWAALAEAAPQAPSVLLALAVLPVNAVPPEVCIAAALGSDSVADLAMAAEDRSLLEHLDNGGLRLHPLVHDYARTQLPPGFGAAMANRTAGKMLDPEWLVRAAIGPLAEFVAMLAPVAARDDGRISGAETLRHFIRAIDLQPQCLAPDADALAQIAFEAMREGYSALGAAATAARRRQPGHWMRLEWGTRKHDPALARVLVSSLTVMDFDISADGMTVVAAVDRGDGVGRLRLWRRDGRNWESGFRRHNRPFVGCALSSDGRQVATFAEDGYLELWDAETASRLCSVMLSSNGDGSSPASLAGLCMSDDGRQVLAIEPNQAWLVDLATRSVAWTARAHRKSLALFGKFIANQALVFIDGRVMLVDNTGRAKTLLTDTQIDDVAPLAGGGRFLLRRGNDIQQYDIHGQPGKKIPLDACGNVITFCTDHSGSKAIAGCSNDMMVVFDPSTGAPLAHMKHAGGMVIALKISGNGRWAVSEPLDAGLYYWDLDAATLGPPPAKTEQFSVIASAFRDNGTIVALALDGRYRLYDTATSALIEEVCFYESDRLPVDGSVSADGQWVGVIDKTGKITVAEIGGVTRQWQTGSDHLRPDTLIRLRIEAGRVLVALGKRRLEIWDAVTATLVARRTLREMPSDFSFAPCGSVVAILTTDARLKLWWPNRSRMQTMPAPEGINPARLCLTAGGRTTVVGDLLGSMGMVRGDSAILLCNRAINRDITPIQADDTHNLLVSMAGADRLLLSALADGEQNAGALAGLVFGNIREARLSPDGTHVLVTGDDGAVFMLAIEGGSTPVSSREKLQGQLTAS